MTADVLVLCYHAVSPTWTAALSTTPERFERQMMRLVRRGYRGVTFTDAVTAAPRGRVLAVTFDDAFRSVFELARPILDRLGLPATVFVPTDFVSEHRTLAWPGVGHWIGSAHEHELAPMSWEQMRALAESGWEIGSHTGSHPRLTALEEPSLEDELRRSKAACERSLQRACTSLAYPYGDVDERVVEAAARAGYSAAAALPEGRLEPQRALRWPRIGIYHRDAGMRFALKASPTVRRLRARAPVA